MLAFASIATMYINELIPEFTVRRQMREECYDQL
jgi:hypothetical protein